MAQDPLVLLDGVREVAALASPADPEAATQRAFDAERERSSEHAALPPARRITEQLRLPWREVLAVAHAPDGEQNKLLATKTREPEQDWLSDEHVAAVLQIAATRLRTDTLSRGEYRTERSRILEENRRRSVRKGLLLPTDNQIVLYVGSWEAALGLAGLRTTWTPGPTTRGKAPTLVELIDRFYDAHGLEPSNTVLQQFARANAVPFPAAHTRSPFKTARAEWRRQRQAQGLPEARRVARAARGQKATDYSYDVGDTVRPEEQRRNKWTREDCVEWVAKYIGQLGTGERSTAAGYTDWAATQELAPVMRTIRYHCGSWEAARREALKR
ncbi:MAG: hypothetical protein ABSG93_19055 [Solirubrobacteraceae bacterium]